MALDTGIKEFDFWDMTVGEIVRQIESFNRVKMSSAREKATYDYILASLIVRGVSITLGSKGSFPQIEEVYPNIFEDIQKEQEEKIAEKKAELSILRFKQFAHSYNNRYINKEVQLNSE